MNSNLHGAELCHHLVNQLIASGVSTFVLCPGGRNAALVDSISTLVAADSKLKAVYFPEERSAAFFALGRARRDHAPVAVCVTSGTAAGELLPAMMEAHHSQIPLIALTADRPRRYRGSGAPKSTDQPGIFSHFAKSLDIVCDDGDLDTVAIQALSLPIRGPLHINVCLEDPVRGPNQSPWSPALSLEEFCQTCRRPVAFVSGWNEPIPPVATSVLNGLPVLSEAEIGSNLGFEIQCQESLFKRLDECGYLVDSVLRIGSVPLTSLWRDLDETHPQLPVLNLTDAGYSGLGRPSTTLPMAELTKVRFEILDPIPESFVTQDQELQAEKLALLRQLPMSEPGIVAQLTSLPSPAATVYLGNSLPIREWSFVGGNRRAFGNRGLNGIDGQLSTFLGLIGNEEAWAVLGDLTALYDLAGFWPTLKQTYPSPVNLCIVNNGGGKIFDRMFSNQDFQNQHGLKFECISQFWNIPYIKIDKCCDWAEVKRFCRIPGVKLLEFVPDADQTSRFAAAWQSALKRIPGR